MRLRTTCTCPVVPGLLPPLQDGPSRPKGDTLAHRLACRRHRNSLVPSPCQRLVQRRLIVQLRRQDRNRRSQKARDDIPYFPQQHHHPPPKAPNACLQAILPLIYNLQSLRSPPHQHRPPSASADVLLPAGMAMNKRCGSCSERLPTWIRKLLGLITARMLRLSRLTPPDFGGRIVGSNSHMKMSAVGKLKRGLCALDGLVVSILCLLHHIHLGECFKGMAQTFRQSQLNVSPVRR